MERQRYRDKQPRAESAVPYAPNVRQIHTAHEADEAQNDGKKEQGGVI